MATNKTDPSAEIKAANKALGKALAAADSAAVAKCYTKTATLMPPNMKACKGHKAIAAFWQGAINMGVKNANLRSTAVDAHGTTAIEHGVATLKGDKGVVLDVAKYVVVWKRENGAWKLHWDIWNSNNAAA